MKKSTYKALTIITVILCLVTLAVAWTSSWFTNWNLNDWSKKWEDLFGIEQDKGGNTDNGDNDNGDNKPPLNDNDVVAISNNGDSLGANDIYNMPKSFAYVCSENSANKSITVTATVLPDNATDKRISWSIEWVDANSEFAKGKNVTNYVSITPNDNQCTITYIADFGSQIKVNATSNSDTSISASCNVDCVQKVILTNVCCITTDIGDYYDYAIKDRALVVQAKPTYTSVYTISNKIKEESMDFTYSLLDSVITAYIDYYPDYEYTEESYLNRKYHEHASYTTNDPSNNYTYNSIVFHFKKDLYGTIYTTSILEKFFSKDSSYHQEFVYEFTKNAPTPMFNLNLTLRTDYYTESIDLSLSIEKEFWKIPVDDIVIDNGDGSVIF